MVPNFFLEVKDTNGGARVAKRQAGYDGAIGARAMHALQNYSVEEPAFDGNAYTYSSTYHAGTGTLQLYAHHPTPPTAPGGRPEYHMTPLRGYALTSDIDTFRRGATAFRNARDLAQTHRDSLIQAANAKACQSGVEAPPEPETTAAAADQYDDSTTNEFLDCEDFDHAAPEDVDEEFTRDPASVGAEPAMNFATSFTSSFTAQSQTSSKRNRDSPPSRPRKKPDLNKTPTLGSTHRPAAGSSAQSSASSGSTVPLPALAEKSRFWSDKYEKWYQLNEDGSHSWDEGE